MQIIASSAALTNALALAAAAVRSNNKLAAPVRIIADEGAVSITCSGPHIAITAKAAAEVILPGQVAVAADRLASLAAGFDASAKIVISVADAGMVAIESGNSRSRLPVFPWDDLPAVLAIDADIGRVEISGSDLLSLLSPLPAAGTEPARFYLCGIFWHTAADTLTAVSTDGARLIRTSIAASRFSEGRELIVPSQAAAVLFRLIRSTRPGRVTLRRSRTLLAVTWPDFGFTSRLIDGTFPAYEAVIPAASPNTITCDRAELLAALSRLAAVATVEPPLLALSFDSAPQLGVYLARQPDDGRDAIGAETVGAAKVAVPLKQLGEMLEEFRGNRVRLEAAGGDGPLVLRGVGNKLGILMGCRWNF